MALTNDSPWCNAFLTNRDWIPADLSVIRWDDCTTPSLWLELLYRTMFPAGGQYPLQMTSDVLREGLHVYWQQSGIPEPSGRELGSWFFENLVQCNATKNGLDTYIEKYALRTCEKEFCKRLPWQGNSDQAGRGMMVCYLIQAILVTIYASILILSRSSASTPRSTPSTRLGKCLLRIQESAHESLREFLDASLIFSFAMIIAAIISSLITLSAVRNQKADIGDLYALSRTSLQVPLQSSVIFSAFAALFTVFPAIALHASAQTSLRRKKWRAIMWVVLGACTLAMFALSRVAGDEALNFIRTTENSSWRDPDGQLIFEFYCIDQDVSAAVRRAVLLSFVAVCFSGIVYFVVRPVLERRQVEENGFEQEGRDKWSVCAALLAMIVMWVTLAGFYYYRRKIGSSSGGTNKDHAWTFGQIVAISTFAPIVIQFMMIMRKGPEKALTGTMSTGYRAQKVEGAPQGKTTYASLEPWGAQY